MVTLSEMIFYGGYSWLHNFHLVLSSPAYWRSKKGKGTKELEQSKRFSTNIQEVTSNVAITEKNEKQNVRLQLSKPRTLGAFSDKVAPDISSFTDEPVVQCVVQVVKNSFVDDSK